MFRITIHIIIFLTLSVLIGSVLFFGAGVAGVLFQPDLIPSRTLSGAVNVSILHRLNVLTGACSGVLALALAYMAFASPRGTSRIAFWLSVPLLIVTLYATLLLFPEINGLRLEIGDFDNILSIKEPLHEQFQSLHVRYSRIVQGGLIASLLILIVHVAHLALRADLTSKNKVATNSVANETGTTTTGSAKKVGEGPQGDTASESVTVKADDVKTKGQDSDSQEP